VRSRVAGTFVVNRPQDLPGRYLREGQEIGYVLPSDSRIVRAAISQDDFELVRSRLRHVRVKLAQHPGETLPAQILREMPAGQGQLPSKALGEAGGGLLPVDPRDPLGRKVALRVFHVDLELPAEYAAIAAFGSRVYVRFDHAWEPIGQQVKVYDDVPKTIIGVVASARQWGLDREPSPEVYFPIYDSVVTDLAIVAKTRVAPALAVEPLRRLLREAAPDLPVTAVRTMEQVVSEGNTMRRFFSTMMIAFSVVALLLAMVGLYGLIAYSVAQRRMEIGVRMSLGADRSRVLKMILRQGLRLVAVGLIVGIVGSLALSSVLGALLYGVAPRDPLVLAAVALVLFFTGALASAVPALRASRVAPVEALRHS